MRNDYLVIDLENNREDFSDAWNIIKAIKKNKGTSMMFQKEK